MVIMNEIYVGNIAYGVTEQDLRDFFGEFGSIKAVKLIKDAQTGQSKGFAFIQYNTQAEAENAAKMGNSKPMQGRNLKVNMARPKERSGGGGGGGGGGGYGGGYGNR
jgi:RNA recognition motif-containing protein